MEKEKRVCLRNRDFELLLFLSEYGVISNENVKLKYNSEYYYKNRLASLAKGEMIERLYGKVVLGRKGKKYLKDIGIKCRNINREENYQKRMARVSDIACKIQNAGWYFEPSWKCDVNTYTKKGNRYVGVITRYMHFSNGDKQYYGNSYLVYYLTKDITSKELIYINSEMERNSRYFKGIIVFVQDEQFLLHPKFTNISISELYTVLYDETTLHMLEKIKDEYYMKDRILDIFGDEYKKLKTYIYEIYCINNNESYIYVFPMLFPDFSKINSINAMSKNSNYKDVEFKVVCEEYYVYYIRKFLDEKIEVICMETEGNRLLL